MIKVFTEVNGVLEEVINNTEVSELSSPEEVLITETGYPAFITPEMIMASDRRRNNEESRDYLSSTDWYITRHAETGVTVPADVLTKREAARASVINNA